MVFWWEEYLETIGKNLGNFVALEDGWDTKVDRRCMKILVEMDLRNGIFEELVIKMHNSQWRQQMDYWKVMFRCFGCLEVGHQQRDYAKGGKESCFKKIWVRKDVTKKDVEFVSKKTVEGGENEVSGKL